jgi:hypothetical protein
MADASRAKRIHERHGARVHASQITAAGTWSGRVQYVMFFDDMAAYGRASMALNADPEWGQFVVDVLQAADPTATLVGQSVATSLPGIDPLAPTTGGGPRATTVRRWTVEQGRFDEAVAILQETGSHITRLGGRFSASQLAFAGENTGQVITLVECDDMAALGTFADRQRTDPEFGQFLRARLGSAGSPLRLVHSLIRVELPI